MVTGKEVLSHDSALKNPLFQSQTLYPLVNKHGERLENPRWRMDLFARNSLRISTFQRIDWDLPTHDIHTIYNEYAYMIYIYRYSVFYEYITLYFGGNTKSQLKWQSWNLTKQSRFSVWIFCYQWTWRETWFSVHPYSNFNIPKPFQWGKFENLTPFLGKVFLKSTTTPKSRAKREFWHFDVLNQFQLDFLSLEGELCQQIYEESDRTAWHGEFGEVFFVARNRKRH